MRLICAAATAAVTGLLLIAGCQGGDSSPLSSTTALTPPSTPTYNFTPGGDSLVASFHVTLDPATMAATATPIAGRESAMTQARSFDLDLAQFQKPDSFKIQILDTDAEGNFVLWFTHAHPFGAPNFANPITAANRADLSYTARLLIVPREETQEFFTDVRLTPGFILNADGYVNPGDLLQASGSASTVFPYVLLCDEAKDIRFDGVTNGGNPKGNYNAATGGWQRDNIGAENIGWTGYDFIHGGQKVGNFLTISKKVLDQPGDIEFDVAILLKYTDPRGVGGRDFRMPFEPADPVKFAYRLPFAALDASQVKVTEAIDVNPLSSTTAQVALTVRDWDAQAAVSTDSDPELLFNEPDVSKIQPGAQGAPTVELDLYANQAGAGEPIAANGTGTGLSDDPLGYGGSFTVEGQLLNDGEYWACLEITDPENALDDSAYHFGVDPNNVTLASADRALMLKTWQVVPITVLSAAPPVITEVTPVGEVGATGGRVTFTALATPAATDWSWDFGGGTFPATSTNARPEVILLTSGTYTGSVTASNASGDSDPFPFEYTIAVGEGADPVAIITRPGTMPPIGTAYWNATVPYPATTDTKPIYLNRTAAADFSGADSFDPDGTIANWDWDFENVVTDPADFNLGFTSDLDLENPPPYAFTTYGSTFVSLRVTDNDNRFGFKRREVIVTPFEAQRQASPPGLDNWFNGGSDKGRTSADRIGNYLLTGGNASTGAVNGYFTFTSVDAGATWAIAASAVDSAALPGFDPHSAIDVNDGVNPYVAYVSEGTVYFRRATSATGTAMWAPTSPSARAEILDSPEELRSLSLAASPATPNAAVVAVSQAVGGNWVLELHGTINANLGGSSSWGLIAEVVMNTEGGSAPTGVQVRLDSDDHAHIVWQEQQKDVFYAQVDTADGTVFTVQQLSDGAEATGPSRPSLWVTTDDEPLVAYAANLGGGNPDINLRKGDSADETVFGSAVICNTDNTGNPSGSLRQVNPTVVQDAGNRIWVAWQDDRRNWVFTSGRGEIFFCLLDSELNVLIGDTIANNFDPFGVSRDEEPTLAIDDATPNAGPVLLWQSQGGPNPKAVLSARPVIQ